MAVNPSNNYSYTRMGYKIDEVQYWICGSCELTPPFTDPDLHNFKYHMSKDSLKIPQTGKFEFPELFNKCTDATFNGGTLEYTNTTVRRADMKLPSSNKEALKKPVQLAWKRQKSGVRSIFPIIPGGFSYYDYLPPERDENSIASKSTASALEVANPKPIQKLLTDHGKSLARGQTQPDSELETKNACKRHLRPNKRQRGKDEDIKIEEEFTNLRETLWESMAQILSIKQKLSERKEILQEENAKMDKIESELRRRKESLDAASEAAEKEFNRVKAQEEDWKKKAAELQLQVRLETEKQARDLELREREEVIKLEEAEVKARNLKLSEREKAIQLEEVELKARDSRLSERNELVKAASEKLENENKNLRIRETEQEEMAKRLELRAAALEMKLAELKY